MTTTATKKSNEILDLHTLEVVRTSIAAQKRLIHSGWSAFRRLFGIPVGVDYCAVGSVFKPWPGTVTLSVLQQVQNQHDLDPYTLAHVITMNDKYLAALTPEQRRGTMLYWLDNEIRSALSVKREIERRAAVSQFAVKAPGEYAGEYACPCKTGLAKAA